MKPNPRVLLATLALWAAVQVEAQSIGGIKGRVLTVDGTPLSGATVTRVGLAPGAITDARGDYIIASVAPGAYVLRVEYLGFQTNSASVRVAAGTAAVQNFRMVPAAIGMREIVVSVGTRTQRKAADELAVPVDVYQAVELRSTGRIEMTEVLQELAPSVYFARPQISDLTSGVRPFQLRGLSPDHALVLINGKRRHSTSVVHVFGTSQAGSSGVDMNALPPHAIQQMEVMRDGASAQYGSDAIAGVINMQLRNDIHAPEFSATLGQFFPDKFPNDGRRWDVTGNWGLSLLGRGSINITGQASDRQPTNRAAYDSLDQVVAGDKDLVRDTDGDGILDLVKKNNPVPNPTTLWGDGEYRNYALFWNAELPVKQSTLYAFGGASRRVDRHSGNFRRSIATTNWPQIHPHGYLPTFRAATLDLMLVSGMKAEWRDWEYELSGQWGGNRVDVGIINSLNVSLGPCLDHACAPGADAVFGTADDPGIPNKTDFNAGKLRLNQFAADFDMKRSLDLFGQPLTVAVGTLLRADNYQVIRGEPASFMQGGYRNRAGGVAQPGSQVFEGFRPEHEADAWRTNIGVFADVESQVGPGLLVALAGRFERYSDFGSTVTGKLALRYQPAQRLVLRAASNTGFRAPSLSQSYYTHISTQFRRNAATGLFEAFEVGEFPVGSPEARALGSSPLKAEHSINYSAGLAVTPHDNLHVTADFFYIDVQDQIMLSNTLLGPFVESVLAQYQAVGAKYATNALNSATRGIDVTANYRRVLRGDHFLELVGSFNVTRNRLYGTENTPAVLKEANLVLFNPGFRYAVERSRPSPRGVLKTRYSHGPLRVSASANYHGEATSLVTVNPQEIFSNPPVTTFDTEVNVRLFGRGEITIGAENVFDAFPQLLLPSQNVNGSRPFGLGTIGANGRYLFARFRTSL